MKRAPVHPSITPMRALALLLDLERERHKLTPALGAWVVDNIRDALRNHVQAALVRGRRKR